MIIILRGFSLHPQIFFCTPKNYSFDPNGWKKNVKRILTSVSFFFVFLWNRCQDSFHIFLKRISTSISLLFFYFLWNGCRDPFHIFLKRISTSVSLFFFVKRMLRSVSHFSETDLNIHFIIFFCETDVEIRFTFFWNESWHSFHYIFLFLWNGCRDPFHIFLKRISTSVLLFLFLFFCVLTFSTTEIGKQILRSKL